MLKKKIIIMYAFEKINQVLEAETIYPIKGKCYV